MVGHGDDVAGRRAVSPRVARPQHRHDEPDDAPARLRGEEREERSRERSGRAQLLPRQALHRGAGEQGGAGGAARRVGGGEDERDGVARHRRQPASPARLALNAWMASTGVGSTP